MAVEWLVCEDCNRSRRRGPISLSAGPAAAEAPPKDVFGEHKNTKMGKRCPGSDKRPITSYWGDSVGKFFHWERNPRNLPGRACHHSSVTWD